MSISAINAFNNQLYKPTTFTAIKPEKTQEKKFDENPISRLGETANLVKATFIL